MYLIREAQINQNGLLFFFIAAGMCLLHNNKNGFIPL